MSAFDTAVRTELMKLEDIRASSMGVSKVHARKAVARDIKVAPGTLENIRNKRTKGVRGWIAETIRSALLRELQREIARLTHEYQVLLASGASHRDCEMEQVGADLARVRQSLEGMK